MKGKHVIVTSGGTREYIDDVRVMTNVSSGALGARIGEEFFCRGATVHFVNCKQSVKMDTRDGVASSRVIDWPVVSCNDMYDTMKTITKSFEIDGIVHCAAVSDFTFKLPKDGCGVKLSSSSEGGFIEYLAKTIQRTPKILPNLRTWAEDAIIVGFKFTSGKTTEELIEIADDLLNKNDCDFVVANDKMQMERLRNHQAHFVWNGPRGTLTEQFGGKDRIAIEIANRIERTLYQRGGLRI